MLISARGSPRWDAPPPPAGRPVRPRTPPGPASRPSPSWVLYYMLHIILSILRYSIIKGPPEYCQDGTVTLLNYNRLL